LYGGRLTGAGRNYYNITSFMLPQILLLATGC
jgi:hypothetical protein